MNRSIPVGASPRITIEVVSGDLSIVGWEGAEILIKGDEHEIRVQQDLEAVTVSSDDDLSLRVPAGSSLGIIAVAGDAALRGLSGPVTLQTVKGDLSIRDVSSLTIEAVNGDFSLRGASGHVELKTVSGDLTMRDVNSVSIDSVTGDFSLRGAKGSLRVKNLSSDASVREVQGDVELTSVAEDLALSDVRGSLKANVGSDVVLYLDPKPGQACIVTAGDDILLVLPPQADATLTLSGDEIDLDWPGVEKEAEATERVITLGQGDARIDLRAGGDIRVSSEAGAGERAQEYGNFAGMMFDWSDFGEGLAGRISRRLEDAARRAEQKAARAVRKAEQKLRGNVNVGRWNWNIQPGSLPAASAAASDPVSEAERMAILKMLQDKKINSEEADKLLAALEGGE